jgi:hypothetical protein
MQIGPHRLLSFLPGSTLPLAAQAGDQDSAASTVAASSDSTAPRETTASQEDAGVILAIQSDTPATAANTLPQDLVYSKVRKSAASTDDRTDTERMAARHQQAVERTAGSTSSLSVDKDGVLVAEPASPEEIKVQQFVHFAVTAMREYADAQDRLKTAASSQEDSTPGASLIPRGLAEVQKLAARFRLFA